MVCRPALIQAIYRTCLAGDSETPCGDQVPAGTTLVTPALKSEKFYRTEVFSSIHNSIVENVKALLKQVITWLLPQTAAVWYNWIPNESNMPFHWWPVDSQTSNSKHKSNDWITHWECISEMFLEWWKNGKLTKTEWFLFSGTVVLTLLKVWELLNYQTWATVPAYYSLSSTMATHKELSIIFCQCWEAVPPILIIHY